MKTAWIVDQYMVDLATERGCRPITDALVSSGTDHVVLSSAPHGATLDLPGHFRGRPVMIHGSFRFLRQTRARAKELGIGLFPGAYCDVDNLAYSVFASRYGKLLLNHDFVMLPFGEFKRRGRHMFPWRCFVRPNGVTKSFTGTLISKDDFDHEIRSLEALAHVMPEDLVVVASSKEILRETRFVIVSGKVVASSTYGWKGNHEIGRPVDPQSLALAEEVARNEWQPDRAYTCDIALTYGTDVRRTPVARVIELNSFSCASLYACDPDAVVAAVSAAAEEDWSDMHGV